MTISFTIHNSGELRTIVDSLTFAFSELAEGRLFAQDKPIKQIMRGLTIDRIADEMISSYNDNKESAEYSVVAVNLSHHNVDGEYTHVECEYCQTKKEVYAALQYFEDRGFDKNELSIKRLKICEEEIDDGFYDEPSDNDDDDNDNDYDPNDYCDDFGS